MNVVRVFKHVDDNFAGEQRVKRSADIRVPDTAGENIHNDNLSCWYYFEKLRWWGTQLDRSVCGGGYSKTDERLLVGYNPYYILHISH